MPPDIFQVNAEMPNGIDCGYDTRHNHHMTTQQQDTLYKVLGEDMRSCHGGDHVWTPGEWTPTIEPRMCEQGWHLCRGPVQLLEWLGPQIWMAEARGTVVESADKICVASCRIIRRIDAWNPTTARLLACDCAERPLHRERQAGREPDPRSWDVLRVARAYAVGAASQDQLDAARDAAWDAEDAAKGAAKGAAWAAARAAARDAAEAAWDAARSAARDAAWDAARDAWDAARDAWDAARGVAWDAEREWQAARLHHALLHGDD